MKISKIEINKLNMTLTQSLKVSLGIISEVANVVVKITTESGIYGWGEASPFAPITGDSVETNYVTAKKLAELIKGKDALAIEARMTEINRFTVGEPSIRSAFDMALYDIAAKAANMPLYKFLGGEQREIRSDMTIGWQDTVEQTVAKAQQILDDGFNAIKMKVGRPGLEDVPHVKAVRDLAGPDIAIKMDSNQSWDYATALANINAMKSLNLEYSEQPLPVWDYDNLARLRAKVDLPICADESVFDDKDALKLVKAGAADYLNIKLGKAGGIHTGLKINAIAEANGSKCMIGCFAESRLGLSAAAHLATARPNIFFIDLDSAYAYSSDPVIGGVSFDKHIGGRLILSDDVGHGAEINEDFLNQETKITV
jgi:L-alanine-DL-glutamate epimerase-like enolase superfamily enzyme